MRKSDIFQTEVKVTEEKIMITLTFSNIIRYGTTLVLTEDVTIDQYLEFLDKALSHKDDKTWTELNTIISVVSTKTTVTFTYKDVYFKISARDIDNFIQNELYKLITAGIIKIEEKSPLR